MPLPDRVAARFPAEACPRAGHAPSPRPMKRSAFTQSGFTLMELMLAVGLLGILLAMALPNYRTMVQNNCITSVTNHFIRVVQLARSEAAKRGTSISIRKSSQGSDWNTAWEVVQGNQVLRVETPSCSGVELLKVGGGARSFAFTSRGATRTKLEFTACDSRTGEKGRTISIAPSGRPGVKEKSCA